MDARVAQRAQVGRLNPMSIELPKEVRDQAVASLQRYIDAELDERFGNLAAGSLLGFFLKEIAPVVYNQAVSDVQERIQMRVTEIDIEVFEEPFGYWTSQSKEGKKR
jgi:uncharacterized protein (DUF2164 family)